MKRNANQQQCAISKYNELTFKIQTQSLNLEDPDLTTDNSNLQAGSFAFSIR